MNEDISIKGRWWINGPNHDPLLGTLNIKSGEITLSVWTPQERTADQVVFSVATKIDLEVSVVITGKGENNEPITLFGCGVDNSHFSGGLSEWNIGALAVVKGLKIESWEHPTLYTVAITPRFLHRWFGRRLLKPIQSSESQVGVTYADALDEEHLVEPGVHVRFYESTAWSSTGDESTYSHHAAIWFHFTEPRSLNELTLKWIPWVNRLLGLLAGVPMINNEVEIFTRDPWKPSQTSIGYRANLFMNGGKGQNRGDVPDSHRMFAPFSKVQPNLGQVISEWNRISKQLEPVVSLFSAIAFYHSFYDEARFLFLVQAMEIYHACSDRFVSIEVPRVEQEMLLAEAAKHLPEHIWKWAKGKLSFNSRSLMQKLLDVMRAHVTESESLFGDLVTAASKIAYTRNHLTHHHEKVNANRLLSGNAIHEAAWRMEALLWVVLLREIGVEGSAVERVVRRAQGIRFVTLA